MLAIEVNKLVKQYKNGVRALDDLSLRVNNGEIFSLLGPNGAGKSSLINILTTYLAPTSGAVTMLEKDISKEPAFIRSRIACVAQHISIDMHLSLEENMMFQGRLYKVDSATAKERMKNLIECFGLEQYLKYPVFSCSGGVKRRLDIAMNMMSHPKILFLDEPTVGMDIQSRMAMWGMMKKIRNDFGTTIFLTTHYLEEADQLSDTICIMKNGHEIVQAAPHDLRQYIRQDVLRIGFDNIEQAKVCASRLKTAVRMKSIEVRDTSIFANTNESRKDFIAVNQWLLEQKIDFVAIEIIQPGLEDVFLNLTEAGGKEVQQ
ncbi:MAG: ABC transporter ATP-binding protein [Eubacteriales bacterium]